MTHDQLVSSTALAARLAGCDCDVTIVVEEFEPLLFAGHCHHDSWCRLLNRHTAQWN